MCPMQSLLHLIQSVWVPVNLKDLCLYLGNGDVPSLMASQVLASTNGLRRYRPVFGLVICRYPTRCSFYLTTWRGKHERRSGIVRGDPDRIFLALREVFGCSQSHVALQEAFFSRRQLEGEGLLEFSLALMGLMEKVKQRFPGAVSNAPVLLCDQFVEHVADNV